MSMAITPNRGYQLPIREDLKESFDQIVSALGAIDVDVAAVFAAMALRATLNSPAFTGTPTAPTQDPGDNSSRLATTAFVAAAVLSFSPSIVNASSIVGTIDDARLSFQVSSFVRTLLDDASAGAARTTLDVFSKAEVNAAVAALVAAAPGTLDTLNELAAALGDDPNFATTMTTLLAGKATKADGTQALARAGVDTVQRTWRAADLKDAAIAAGGGVADAILEDQKPAGTSGGATVATTWTDHVLNTKAYDPNGLITLTSNHFVASVDGRVEWQMSSARGDLKSALYNVTDGVFVSYGMSVNNNTSPDTGGAVSSGGGPVTAGKEYALRYYATQSMTNGLGFASSQGTCVYLRVQFGRTQ
ncbi:hypothetical protein [Mesorhizobium sp.]|uniref:hypothetical protein n=1 Tax=Mesorhizobium sp. TaxID=1871066 RepID=UPI0025F5AAAE|nr:hypothetical protein [Mesorhizobium sp.]